MPLVGIIAKKKDVQAIRKEIKGKNIEIIEITKESVKNIKNKISNIEWRYRNRHIKKDRDRKANKTNNIWIQFKINNNNIKCKRRENYSLFTKRYRKIRRRNIRMPRKANN